MLKYMGWDYKFVLRTEALLRETVLQALVDGIVWVECSLQCLVQ